jgi:outer membrane lipoprotein-sorting protein
MESLVKMSVVCCWLLVSTAVSAQITNPFAEESKVSYSGVREMMTSQGTFKMKEYHAPQRQRMEMEGPSGPMVMINRSDKSVAWMLMPSMNMYMEVSSAKFEQQTGSDVNVIEYTKVGSETIDGHKVDKYKSIFEDAKGNRGGGYYWITKDGIPLKMDMVFKDGEKKHRMTMTLKELKVGPQPDSLFEIPAGYSGMPTMGDIKFPTGMSGGDPADPPKESASKPSLKSLFKKLY